jgi:adenosylcobinamide-GDP ribazoletransferase
MGSSFAEDMRACLRFYSRLPAGAQDHAMPDFARASRAAPAAGAVIGVVAASVMAPLSLLGLPPLVVGVCVVAALVLTTGALHEDGLADLADGFGGGATRDRKLEIMRDSRLGAYGVLALVLSTLLRVAAIAGLMAHGVFFGALAIIAASALSRAVGLWPLATLPPARAQGAGASAAAPSSETLRQAVLLGVAVALAPLLAGASAAQLVVAISVAFAGALGVTRLAARQIGGYTGDVLGAAQQAAEIGMLAVFSA